MRIDDRNSVAGPDAGRVAEAAAAQSTAKGKNFAGYRSGIGGDSVELSGASLQILNFETAHAARLDRLAKSVQSGNYQVSPALVGRALVSETLAAQGEYSPR